MLSQSKLFTRLAIVALTLPVLGFCANLGTSISANGTCEYGAPCPNVDTPATAVGIGQHSSDTFNFDITLGDGDKYSVAGTYYNSYPPQELSFLPTVTYVGSSATTTADSISLIMYQAFYDTTGGSWAGNYCQTVAPFSIPSGDSVTGIAEFDGNAGLGTQPGNSAKHCASLDFGGKDASDYMDTAYNLTFNFQAGTTPGTPIGSLTPEPVQTIPVALGLLGLLAFKVRRFRSATRS
jgi:hypothetical protein